MYCQNTGKNKDSSWSKSLLDVFFVLIKITWKVTLFPKLYLKPATVVKSQTASLPNHQLLLYISPYELDDMVYTLIIHHAGVTHRTKHKEKLRTGFILPKIVMVLLVPKKEDFQITAHTAYSERKESNSEDLQRKTVFLIPGTSAKGKKPTQTGKKKKPTTTHAVRILSLIINQMAWAMQWAELFISTFPPLSEKTLKKLIQADQHILQTGSLLINTSWYSLFLLLVVLNLKIDKSKYVYHYSYHLMLYMIKITTIS